MKKSIRLLLLSDPNNTHTKRWVEALYRKGVTLCLFGLGDINTDYYNQYKDLFVCSVGKLSDEDTIKDGRLNKLKYLKVLPQLKKVIKEFRPNIVHAHYASSYGLLGVLSGFHPLVLTVWGSDIFCFPKVSFIHKQVLKFVLRKADFLVSTSHSMASEARKYVDREFEIIPFGIDSELFSPNRVEHDAFTIGCTKTLAPIYGIDKLIKAFALAIKTIDAKLVLVGDGPEKSNLQELAESLDVIDKVYFEGRKDNSELPKYYNQFDIAIYLSLSESFGVVALEAMACECPLILSKATGFQEVVPSEAGVFVDANEEKEVARQIIVLAQNKERRAAMGKVGRKHVVEKYCWNDNVEQMMNCYLSITTL